ncbi:MAG: PAS domain-containing protein, partial [Thermoplasmatota archaeon]
MSDDTCVFFCDREGRVLEMLKDDLSVLEAGRSMFSILDEDSVEKGSEFLKRLRTQGHAYNWEVVLREGEGIPVAHLTGWSVEGDLLVIMVRNPSQVTQVPEARFPEAKRREDYYRMLEEVTRLNNELTNAHRRLAKQSARLGFEKERFEKTLSSIGDGVISTDKHMRISFVNEVGLDLLGWKEEEVLGHRLDEVFQIFDGESGEDLTHLFSRTLEEGKRIKLPPSTLLKASEGDHLPISDTLAPVED